MRIAIIGGGIGGLTAGIALGRAGFEAHIYEAAPALQVVGKGIWVPTNAMRVLAELGLADRIAAAGVGLEHIEIRTSAGTRLQRVDLHAVAARLGHTTISIPRSELQRVLAESVPASALHLGAPCVGVSTDGNGAEVSFADGARIAAELVVGADGIKSLVRREVTDAPPLRYLGQTTYRGIAKITLPDDIRRTCVETWGGALRFGFSALAPGCVYWFAPVTAPADGAAAALTPDQLLSLGDHAFPRPIPDILSATPPSEILRTDLHDLPTLKTWHRGRIVLLGDAAHAMAPNLGQGGAQAIEDALALARDLGRTSNVAEALTSYERRRRSRVRRVADMARRYGVFAQLESGALRSLRDLAIRASPAPMTSRTMDWLYRGEA